MFNSILVPLDGSTPAEAALEQAKYLAQASGGTIHLARVCQRQTLESMADARSADELVHLEETRCQNYLENMRSKLAAEGYRADYQVLPAGSPAVRLLENLEARDIDLLVMSSHGRTGLNRMLMGSVAEKLARHAPCPVLVVGRQGQHHSPAANGPAYAKVQER